MKRLEVSSAVRPIYGLLSVKRLMQGTTTKTKNTTNAFVVKAYQTCVYLLQACVFATGLQTSKVSALQNEHLEVIAKVLPLTRTYHFSSQLHLQILCA
jgi:hypothetical protein